MSKPLRQSQKHVIFFTLDHLSLEQRQKLLEKFEMIMLKVDQQRMFEELYANGDENYPSVHYKAWLVYKKQAAS